MFAQDIAGVWKGLIYGDSLHQYLPYEVVISDENGKLSGYTQTTYTIDNKNEIWLRKIKVMRKDDKIVLEDISVVDKNSDLKPSKGIKKVAIFTFSVSEGEVLLTGEWSSNHTREFMAMHGTIQLLKENEYKKTGIFKQLDSLKLSKDLSFHKKEIKAEPVIAKAPPPEKKVVKKVEKQPDPVVEKEPEPVAAAEVTNRKTALSQTVFYKTDSLILTLYDNGEVDGDVVSVLLDGKVIFANQTLTTKANSKTIYLPKGTPDSVMLVMYAENLGSIPPNTGLLIILDGNERYELRFTADLKTNAAIILKRKKQ